MHIAVIDEDGTISGTTGTILETFEGVSQAHDAKNCYWCKQLLSTMYYMQQSKFIYWVDHLATLSDGLD